MSLTQYNKALAEDFISLKNKIKTECARRDQEGSVAQYGVDEYWDTDPEQSSLMDDIQINKIIEPLSAIMSAETLYNDYNLQPVSTTTELIKALDGVDEFIDTISMYEMEAESTGCNASCTGLCSTSCATGCKSTCTNGCTGNCKGCTGSCSGGCSGNCSGGCYGCTGCSGGCKGCAGSCSGSCKGTCSAACRSSSRSGQQS